MNIIKNIFSYDFLFYVNRVRLETVDWIFAGIAAGLLVLGIIFLIRMKFTKNPVVKKFAQRVVSLSFTTGILGALWFGARYQNANFFGSHFVFLLVVLVGILWLYYVLRYRVTLYGQERRTWEKEQLKLKYLN